MNTLTNKDTKEDDIKWLNDSPNNLERNPIEVISENEVTKCYYISDKEKILLAEINAESQISIIYPTNTIEKSSSFKIPKYNSIGKIIFEGYEITIEENEYSGKETIYGFPDIFTKTLEYGLGLEKKYKIIINTLVKYNKTCDTVIISKSKISGIEGNKVIINDDDLDTIRRGIDRNQDLYQQEALEAKESLIYNSLLYEINPELYPELKKKAQRDVIYKILKSTDFKSSRLSQADKQSIYAIKDSAELSYLQILTNEFETKISETHKENTYQTFFEENPFLLTVISGSPYVKFQNQAYVGGKSFDNSNGKYPDFLLKHKAINNTFIIEIKTPNSRLLDTKKYREDVYSPSKELSGSISQILSQKYSLETEIASLSHNSEDKDIEAYNVQGLIIIGKLDNLKEKAHKRSFELFRNNQKNIRIITYDECFEILKSMIEYLSEKQEK
jgi:hypothetical protein